MKKYFFLVGVVFTTLVSCSKSSQTDTNISTNTNTTVDSFIKGADISWLTQMEANGISFYNSAGSKQDCFTVLTSQGVNAIRLRVWVNPSNGYNNSADVLAKAIRAKNAGLKLMIDFHYSDTWADPGAQTKPAAWNSLNFTQLRAAMAQHTIDVLTNLKNAGIDVRWVQVGNETNDGMLWPDGKASTNMANFASLITAGYDAVKSVYANAKVIVHISNGQNNSLFRWVFDGLQNNNAKWDIIGMSLYPDPGTWNSLVASCDANMADLLTRYGKPILITEVGMSWDYPTTCKDFLTDLITRCKQTGKGKINGIFYWEPESYGNWQGYTKGAFDNSGKPTIALDAFK